LAFVLDSDMNGCLASEARQAEGIGRGAVGRSGTPQGLSTGSSCGQVACPRRARVLKLLEGLHGLVSGCLRTQTACAMRAAASLSR